MGTQAKVASRYAKALFENLSASPKKAEAIVEELQGFAALVEGHPELKLLLHSPGFSESAKQAVVEDLLKKLSPSQQAKEILLTLSRMERLASLPSIVERLKVLWLESQSIQPIEVWTSAPVAQGDKELIEERFSKVLGKKVQATYSTQPGLVGGMRVLAGGRTYDGTVSGWLESLRERLVQGEV